MNILYEFTFKCDGQTVIVRANSLQQALELVRERGYRDITFISQQMIGQDHKHTKLGS